MANKGMMAHSIEQQYHPLLATTALKIQNSFQPFYRKSSTFGGGAAFSQSNQLYSRQKEVFLSSSSKEIFILHLLFLVTPFSHLVINGSLHKAAGFHVGSNLL